MATKTTKAKPTDTPDHLALGKAPSLQDWATLEDVQETVKGLVWGDPGSGKTVALAHMAKLGPVLYIEIESGLKRRVIQSHGIDPANIRLARPRTYDEFQATLHQAGQLAERKEIIGIAIDSLTEVQTRFVETIVLERHDEATAAGMDDNPFEIKVQEWGTSVEMLRRLVRGVRDIPCHVAVSCLARRDVDAESGSTHYGPAVSPAVQQAVMGYFDVVIKMEVLPGQMLPDGTSGDLFTGVCRPSDEIKAKDRFGVLPRRLAYPTFDRLVGYVNGDLTVNTDPLMGAAQLRRARTHKEEASNA